MYMNKKINKMVEVHKLSNKELNLVTGGNCNCKCYDKKWQKTGIGQAPDEAYCRDHMCSNRGMTFASCD